MEINKILSLNGSVVDERTLKELENSADVRHINYWGGDKADVTLRKCGIITINVKGEKMDG